MEPTKLSTASVDAVQAKLQAFYQELPEEEKPVLETLLSHAADGARRADNLQDRETRSIIMVGGRGPGLEIPLNPGVLASLNPQPIPPGRSPVGPDPSPLEAGQG